MPEVDLSQQVNLSQRSEERREIQLLLSSQTQLKAPLVEINHVLKCSGRSIVEIRGPWGGRPRVCYISTTLTTPWGTGRGAASDRGT